MSKVSVCSARASSVLRRRLWAGVATVCLTSVLGASARAQTPGFAVDRFYPADPGSPWFVANAVDSAGHRTVAVAALGDWAHRPLVLHLNDGSSFPAVRDQVWLHLGAAVTLWQRWRFSVLVPVELYSAGESLGGDTDRFATAAGGKVGDLILGASVRLVGEARDRFRLGAQARLMLPTGSRDAYAGDGKLRAMGTLAAAGDVDNWRYAAALGAHFRALTDDYADAPFGTEALVVVAVGRAFWERRLVVGPEVFASTVIQRGNAIGKEATTPIEATLGAKYRLWPAWVAGVAAGPGLSQGLGAPRLRVLASLEWLPTFAPAPPVAAPPAAPAPTPPVAEARPAPDPEPAPIPSTPPAPAIVEAPPADNDGDGIVDVDDACPQEAGEKSADPKKNGCPIAVVVGAQIVIHERIEFDNDKAVLRPDSTPVLEAVRKILAEHPELANVRVEGHTDNRGGKAHNRELSQLRAEAVTQWLVEAGIAKERLKAAGFGQDRPLESNATASGRQNNRRVEFHLGEGAP